MNKEGPIIIIEDDPDDQELFTIVFKKLNHANELIFFRDGRKALDFLENTRVVPFIILSDINLPILSGIDLKVKLKVDAELALKCIPYLYLSTSASQKMIVDAYSASSQGFFFKESSLDEIEKTLRVIMDYWKRCVAPDKSLRAA